MPKYLVQASYTQQGSQGMLKEGGTGRREAIEKITSKLGGKVEMLYFAYGEDDVITVLDFPDNLSMAAVAMTTKASGAVHTKATVLITPEEIDEAIRKTIDFRPPGT